MAPASPWGGPDAVGREEGSRGGGGEGGELRVEGVEQERGGGARGGARRGTTKAAAAVAPPPPPALSIPHHAVAGGARSPWLGHPEKCRGGGRGWGGRKRVWLEHRAGDKGKEGKGRGLV